MLISAIDYHVKSTIQLQKQLIEDDHRLQSPDNVIKSQISNFHKKVKYINDNKNMHVRDGITNINNSILINDLLFLTYQLINLSILFNVFLN